MGHQRLPIEAPVNVEEDTFNSHTEVIRVGPLSSSDSEESKTDVEQEEEYSMFGVAECSIIEEGIEDEDEDDVHMMGNQATEMTLEQCALTDSQFIDLENSIDRMMMEWEAEEIVPDDNFFSRNVREVRPTTFETSLVLINTPPCLDTSTSEELDLNLMPETSPPPQLALDDMTNREIAHEIWEKKSTQRPLSGPDVCAICGSTTVGTSPAKSFASFDPTARRPPRLLRRT